MHSLSVHTGELPDFSFNYSLGGLTKKNQYGSGGGPAKKNYGSGGGISNFPFGSLMPGRQYAGTEYRYGFQSQETDDEWLGEGNAVSYKYRVTDSRLGRFFSVDPLTPEYPWYSPYQFAGNKVTWGRELEGLENENDKSQRESQIESRPGPYEGGLGGESVGYSPPRGDFEAESGAVSSVDLKEPWIRIEWHEPPREEISLDPFDFFSRPEISSEKITPRVVDAVGINIDFDGSVGVPLIGASGHGGISFVKFMNGPDKGRIFTYLYGGAGGGIGGTGKKIEFEFDLSAGKTYSPWVAFYNGADDNITFDSWEGLFLAHGASVSFDWIIGVKLGGGYFYGLENKEGEYWDGTQVDFGVRTGFGFSISINMGDGTYYWSVDKMVGAVKK